MHGVCPTFQRSYQVRLRHVFGKHLLIYPLLLAVSESYNLHIVLESSMSSLLPSDCAGVIHQMCLPGMICSNGCVVSTTMSTKALARGPSTANLWRPDGALWIVASSMHATWRVHQKSNVQIVVSGQSTSTGRQSNRALLAWQQICPKDCCIMYCVRFSKGAQWCVRP